MADDEHGQADEHGTDQRAPGITAAMREVRRVREAGGRDDVRVRTGRLSGGPGHRGEEDAGEDGPT